MARTQHQGRRHGSGAHHHHHRDTTPPPSKPIGSAPLTVAPILPYNPKDKPYWTPAWRKNQAPPAAGYTQGTDAGYDVVALRNTRRHSLALNFANGSLSDNARQFPLFVTDVGIKWALAGTTAQGRTTRDMYPHNFVQPSFVIQGVSLNQEDYGELTEYVHQAQHDALNGGKLIQLDITRGNVPPDTRKWGRQKGRGVRAAHGKIVDAANLVNQITRGPHKPVRAQGYVGSIERHHQTGVYFPTWQFEFVVAVMIQGPYSDELVTIQRQKNWVDVVKGSSIFETQWYIANDQQNLDWVTQNAPNIFKTDPVDLGGGGSSSSGGGSAGTGNTKGLFTLAPGISPSAVPTSGGGAYGAPRSYGGHAGVDVSMPENTHLTACCAGTVDTVNHSWYNSSNGKGQGMISIKSSIPVFNWPAGTYFIYGHPDTIYKSQGDNVNAGDILALSGAPGGGAHLHFAINTSSGGGNGNVDPTDTAKGLLTLGQNLSPGGVASPH